MKSISYKKFFAFTSTVICLVMLLAIVITAVFIETMNNYTKYLGTYFNQEREEGFVIAQPVVLNLPIDEGREFAFNTALIVMPIIGTILTVLICVLYMYCHYKETNPKERARITHHYISFINAGIAFILMSFLEYSFGKNADFAGYTAIGRAFSGLVRCIIMFFGIRFIFMITQIIIERHTMKKREIAVRIIYCVASLTVFIFYTLLAIQYHPKTDTTYTTVFGFIVVPISILIFEGLLLYFKIIDRKENEE